MLQGQTFHFSLRRKDTEKMEQQATGTSDCCTADGLGEGPENRKAAGKANFKGQTDEVPDEKEKHLGDWNRDHPCFLVAQSLASLCPCPEACWKTELPRARPERLAEEIAKHQSVQAAAWLLLKAYSQMREQRDHLKAKLAKKKAELKSQRRSHQDLKKKGVPEEAVSEETKAEKERLSVGNPGSKEDSSSRPKKRSSKLSGKSSLLAKGSSKSAEIPRGQDAASRSGGPCEHPCCTGNCKDLKKIAMEIWRLPPLSRGKPCVSMKTASKLASLWTECEEVMRSGPVVREPQQEHKKTPAHED